MLELAIHSTNLLATPTPDDKTFFRQHDNHNDPKPAIISDEVKELRKQVNRLFIEIFFEPKKGHELPQEELWVLYKGLLPVVLRLDSGLFGRMRNAYHTKGTFSLKLREDNETTVAVTASDSEGNQRTMLVKPTTPPKSKKKSDGSRCVNIGLCGALSGKRCRAEYCIRYYMNYALKLNGHGDAGSQEAKVREFCTLLKIPECNFNPDMFKKVVARTLLRKEASLVDKVCISRLLRTLIPSRQICTQQILSLEKMMTTTSLY